MKTAKIRRDRLFKSGKPTIRPAVYGDIRWLWAAARKSGFNGSPEEFTTQAEEMLSCADRLFMLEDRNESYQSGFGPVGIVAANYDGWTLIPYAEWFEWATTRNKLRCTVGFLQSMRYRHDIGSIKIFTDQLSEKWFKRLKRYIPISLVGKIPGGRHYGDEYIFHVRGRGDWRGISSSSSRVGGQCSRRAGGFTSGRRQEQDAERYENIDYPAAATGHT